MRYLAGYLSRVRQYLHAAFFLERRAASGGFIDIATHQRQYRKMVILPVQMAVWWRQESHPVILHSDRGSQLRSGDYQRCLLANNLTCSMGAVGYRGDNAVCGAGLRLQLANPKRKIVKGTF